MKAALSVLALFIFAFSSGQDPDKYAIVRQDMTRYHICFSDTIRYFAIVGIRHKHGWYAVVQIALIAVMNTIEFCKARDLLLYGKFNAGLALALIIIVFYNEFILRKTPAKQGVAPDHCIKGILLIAGDGDASAFPNVINRILQKGFTKNCGMAAKGIR